MFTITDRAISPRKAVYHSALKRLPDAHREASAAAIAHLHTHVSQAAEDAGLDSSALQVGWHKSTPYLGIEMSPAGDKLFDHEFGTVDEAPAATLRTAVKAAHPAANSLYARTLRSRLGI